MILTQITTEWKLTQNSSVAAPLVKFTWHHVSKCVYLCVVTDLFMDQKDLFLNTMTPESLIKTLKIIQTSAEMYFWRITVGFQIIHAVLVPVMKW